MQYQKTQANGESIGLQGNNGIGVTMESAAAGALTAADSGKIIVLDSAEGVEITLPAVAVAAGLIYRFLTGLAFETTAYTIVAATNVIQGGAIVNSVFVPAVNENTISFVDTAEALGDYVEIVSDGTNWYVSGVGAGAGSITFTAP
jgi:hypothetical protein